jgi:CSLREA domain-containing protein
MTKSISGATRADRAVAVGFLSAALVAACVLLSAGPAHAETFAVNSTGDGGDQGPGGVCNTAPFPVGTEPECTLRAAIEEANTTAAADTINFDIGGSGVKTISPATAFGLPSIAEPVTIDGYTQPGASPNTLAVGNNAAPKIELDGSGAGAGASGIGIGASNVVVRGLVINRFGGHGVAFGQVTGSKIEGNFIGTDPTGTVDLGNGDGGVRIFDGSSNVVGGTAPEARNVISGNAAHGIAVERAQASGHRIEGNYIGTKKDGTSFLANGGAGVAMVDSSDVTVGGATPGAANTIAFNDADGVSIGSGFFDIASTGNRILSNSIFSNALRGIDLDDDGPTPNDAGDADAGANNLQNYPVLSSAIKSGPTNAIRGSLNSTPNATFTLQFLSSPQADPSGFGEGRKFLGQRNVTTDASGDATFAFSIQAATAVGQAVTATATGASGDTSEFSRAISLRKDAVKPAITPLTPKPGSKGFKRTVKIQAVVRDNLTDLAKGNIRLFVDGKRKTGFSYDRATDRLGFTARKLSFKRHTVRITATDGAGNAATKSWSFTVKKR